MGPEFRCLIFTVVLRYKINLDAWLQLADLEAAGESLSHNGPELGCRGKNAEKENA